MTPTPVPSDVPKPAQTPAPTNTPAPTPTLGAHLYDIAEVRDIMNDSRTEKVGEYSLIRVNSSEVTKEALADWYFNYVAKNNFRWSMILYTDRDDNTGVCATSYIEMDVNFMEDEYGEYSIGKTFNGIIYVPTEYRTIEKMTPQEQEPSVRKKR